MLEALLLLKAEQQWQMQLHRCYTVYVGSVESQEFAEMAVPCRSINSSIFTKGMKQALLHNQSIFWHLGAECRKCLMLRTLN